jgi:hypothetical protein
MSYLVILAKATFYFAKTFMRNGTKSGAKRLLILSFFAAALSNKVSSYLSKHLSRFAKLANCCG